MLWLLSMILGVLSLLSAFLGASVSRSIEQTAQLRRIGEDTFLRKKQLHIG